LTATPEPDRLRRQLRILAILSGGDRAGLTPLPAAELHAIAFFADALAPVWGLRILDAELLKRRSGPLSPLLQEDLDALVGRGVVVPQNVRHVRDADDSWRLDADYELNAPIAWPILRKAMTFATQAAQVRLTEEVVLAVSALGSEAISEASRSDAAYGDLLVDDGDVVDIGTKGGESNLTARVALRFGELMEQQVDLTPAEMVHLYVRQLDKRIRRAA
jgi:hypothetical protein